MECDYLWETHDCVCCCSDTMGIKIFVNTILKNNSLHMYRICNALISFWYRVGFLPEETYFFQDTRKKVEETYFFQFCPDQTGRNWTKLEKTVKDVRNVGRKYLSYLISYKRLWLKMHLVNWYRLKTLCKNIKYFWSISSSFIRTKLEETG